jgi:hypothetical protein
VAVAAKKPTKVKVAAKPNGNGANNGNGKKCGITYPPTKSPRAGLVGPTQTRAGRPVIYTGRAFLNGCPVPKVQIGLYASKNGKSGWKLVSSGVIDDDGVYPFKVPGTSTTHYQAVVVSGNGLAPSLSRIVTLKVR